MIKLLWEEWLMKSWEEMKDFSYVGIKLTKAKSIS